jgi:hypothetical protein
MPWWRIKATIVKSSASPCAVGGYSLASCGAPIRDAGVGSQTSRRRLALGDRGHVPLAGSFSSPDGAL